MVTPRKATVRTAKKPAKRATTARNTGNERQDALFRQSAKTAGISSAMQTHIIENYGSGRGIPLVQKHGKNAVAIVQRADKISQKLDGYIVKEILPKTSDTTAEGVRKFDFKNEITRVPLTLEPGIRLCSLVAAEKGMTGDMVIELARQSNGLVDLRNRIYNFQPKQN